MNTTLIYPQHLISSCTVSWFTSSSRLLGFLAVSLSLHGLLFAMIPGLGQLTPSGQQAMHQQPIYLSLNTAPSSNRKPRKPLTASQPARHDLLTLAHHAKTMRTHQVTVQIETHAPLQSKTKPTSQHAIPTRKIRTTQLAIATPSPGESIPTPSPDPAAVAALLRHALQQHFRYPVIALQNSWEGKVVLGVRVTANGEVSAEQVLKASGFRILDRAAQHAVNDIGRLPAASALLAGQTLTFRVPVAYSLRR